MNITTNDILYKYEITNTYGGAYSEKKCNISLEKVLGANSSFLVLDDFIFTKLQHPTREKNTMYDVVNRPRFSVSLKDWFYGTGFRYVLFSTKKRKISAIKKFIQSEINKEAMLLGSILSLDFIEDSPKESQNEHA